MAEPQPSNVQEGADQPDVLPANAEDRKAARAMSSLDAKGDDENGGAAKKEVDLKALGEAMKHLEIAQPKKTAEPAKKEEAPKKAVKVEPADVALLVEELELSKTKATDLLRAHDANVIEAMTAFVTAPV